VPGELSEPSGLETERFRFFKLEDDSASLRLPDPADGLLFNRPGDPVRD
jgi:hypothetical protein